MPKTPTRTEADFKAAHDPNVVIPSKIRAALDTMLKRGREHWEYESDFVKLAGVSLPQLGTFREQFDAHIVLARDGNRTAKRVWFADAKVAKRQRGE